MRRCFLLVACVWMPAGCWQVAGIDVIDLPVHDGQSDDGGTDADAPDEAAVEEPEAEEPAETRPDPVPTDPLDDPWSEDVPPDLPPGMSAEDYCAGTAEAMCGYFRSCCSAEEYDLVQGYFVSCEGLTDGPYYSSCVDFYGSMVDAGRLVIDEESFRTCLDFLQQAGTECLGLTAYLQVLYWVLETTCGGVLSGRVVEGGVCTDRVECAGGACCVQGLCTRCMRGDEGCAINDQCPTSQRCIESSCRDVSGQGGPCDEEDEMVLSDCGSLLWCENGTCSQLRSPSEPCPDGSALNYGCSGLCYDGGSCSSFCGPL